MSDTNQANQTSTKDGVYNYDVIIFGAGASGLALASELSKDFKVLVFDKKKSLGYTKKSWLIPDIVIEEGNAKDLLDYMIIPKDGCKRGVRRFLANTFTSDTMQGANIEWDSILGYQFARDHDLLEYWSKTAENNGATILLDCWYQDSFLTNSQATINTSKGEFVARLLALAVNHRFVANILNVTTCIGGRSVARLLNFLKAYLKVCVSVIINSGKLLLTPIPVKKPHSVMVVQFGNMKFSMKTPSLSLSST